MISRNIDTGAAFWETEHFEDKVQKSAVWPSFLTIVSPERARKFNSVAILYNKIKIR
jgi:hypothetical protein